MLFNSLPFAIFFPIVVILYYLVPQKFRLFVLLIASCYFYASFVPKYILILFFLITVDYFLAKVIEKSEGRNRKIFLVISIITNLGTLFVFKYLNFFNANIAELARFLDWNYPQTIISIALPLGLSFHVFQSLSYVIEVYRGKYKPENNYFNYALYVMFFPQLVAGPIERPQHLLPQFRITHNFDAFKARRGLERMLWGFFKKMVIADRLGVVVNVLYSNPPTDILTTLLLMILFSYQLYCDFSGYSDIAVGTALVLGFDLTENFNRPFAARSISDFWQRWHISLSSWLKDYLYYPLAIYWGKGSKLKIYFSLFITFVLIGLWHGANWTYVLMGAMHGVYLVFGSITKNIREKFADLIRLSKFPAVRHFLQVVTVFFLVSLSFVFFRAENVSQALHIISNLFTNTQQSFSFLGIGLESRTMLVVFLSVILLEVIQYYQEKKKTFYIFDVKPRYVRYAWYYALSFLIIFVGYFGLQPFIYFKF